MVLNIQTYCIFFTQKARDGILRRARRRVRIMRAKWKWRLVWATSKGVGGEGGVGSAVLAAASSSWDLATVSSSFPSFSFSISFTSVSFSTSFTSLSFSVASFAWKLRGKRRSHWNLYHLIDVFRLFYQIRSICVLRGLSNNWIQLLFHSTLVFNHECNVIKYYRLKAGSWEHFF